MGKTRLVARSSSPISQHFKPQPSLRAGFKRQTGDWVNSVSGLNQKGNHTMYNSRNWSNYAAHQEHLRNTDGNEADRQHHEQERQRAEDRAREERAREERAREERERESRDREERARRAAEEASAERQRQADAERRRSRW